MISDIIATAMAHSYKDRDLKILWARSAGRCSFPGCFADCIVPQTSADGILVLGEIAHIVADSDHGPRGDPSFPSELRDQYPNLIVLCPTHHTLVDGQGSTYTKEELAAWKADHERRTRQALAAEMPNVSFVELEVVTTALLADAQNSSIDFTLVEPSEKMDRNGLTRDVLPNLQAGMSKAVEVGRYIDRVAGVQPGFPDRLRAGFVAEYQRLVEEGFGGDRLFCAMQVFASDHSSDLRRQAAGLAVTTYLFEACDIFEK